MVQNVPVFKWSAKSPDFSIRIPDSHTVRYSGIQYSDGYCTFSMPWFGGRGERMKSILSKAAWSSRPSLIQNFSSVCLASMTGNFFSVTRLTLWRMSFCLFSSDSHFSNLSNRPWTSISQRRYSRQERRKMSGLENPNLSEILIFLWTKLIKVNRSKYLYKCHQFLKYFMLK